MNRPARKSDDLFEKSTMSFGEHLEELRRALGKSLIWLLIGTLAGIYFADSVIRYVQKPLESAIRQYYADKTVREMHLVNAQADDAKALLASHGLALQTIWVSPRSLKSALEPKHESNSEAQATSDNTDPQSGTTQETKTKDDAAPQEPSTNTTKSDTTTSSPSAETKDKPTETSETLASTEPLAPSPLGLNEVVDGVGIDFQDVRPVQVLMRVEDRLQSLQSEEPFMMWMKAGLLVGAVLSSPMVFWHLWQFVAAGLYPHERKYVYMYLPISLGLFWGGVILAFFGVLALVLNFFLTFNNLLNVDPEPRLNDYISFVLLLPLGFGIAFQLPLVMLVLERIGLFKAEDYVRSWRIAILAIAVISMVLTPSDVTSMMAMAVPLWGLYFLGIAMCKYMPRGPGIGGLADSE